MQAVLEQITPAFIYDPTLVLYLPLRQLDSAAFADRSAYGHRCTRFGAVWRPNGHWFDAGDDRIEIPGASALDISGAPFTIGAWAKPTDYTQTRVILHQREAADKGVLSLWYGASNVRFGIRDGDGITWVFIGVAVADNHWRHLVGEWDGVRLCLYVNGIGYSVAQPDMHTVTSQRIMIGASAEDTPTLFWGGLIDDVRIYSRALYPAEIQRIYVETRGQYA